MNTLLCNIWQNSCFAFLITVYPVPVNTFRINRARSVQMHNAQFSNTQAAAETTSFCNLFRGINVPWHLDQILTTLIIIAWQSGNKATNQEVKYFHDVILSFSIQFNFHRMECSYANGSNFVVGRSHNFTE